MRVRQRLAFILRHRAPIIAFGLCFAAVFWVPCFSVLMLPVGVVAATDVVWAALALEPEALSGSTARPGSAL
jgi:uncharacterized protein involved in cysteine biosynthesis